MPHFALSADPVVQAALNPTEEQKAKIARIPADLLAKHKTDVVADAKAAAEWSKAVRAQRAERDKKLAAMLVEHLTATQRARFDQLRDQAVLTSPSAADRLRGELGKRLKITADQVAKYDDLLRATVAERRKDFPLYPMPSGDQEWTTYFIARSRMYRDVTARFAH